MGCDLGDSEGRGSLGALGDLGQVCLSSDWLPL